MSPNAFTRRNFLRHTGTSVLLGTAATPALLDSRPASGQPATKPTGLTAPPPHPTPTDFDQVYDRRGTDSVRWDRAIAHYGPNIVAAMGVADMDFRAAPCVTRALAERCAHENWGYMHRPDSYAEAVAAWNHRRYGVEIDPSTLVFTTGVHPGIIAALHTFSPPGTRVLMMTPTYDGFYGDLRFARTVPDDCEMVVGADGRYSVDFDDFERRAQRCNSFILCNPQNPTGNHWSPEVLTRLGEICLKHRVVVLADEIHCDFVSRGHSYTPFATLDPEIVDNSLTFMSGSKSFSLAAMKVAWYYSTNPDLLARIKANTRADLSTLGMVAMRAALNEGEPWLDELVPYIDANHDSAESYIRDNLPGVRYTKAQGTYLAWLDVAEFAERIGAAETAARESAEAVNPVTPEVIVQRWFAERAGVFLNPGPRYGTGGAGHMRMNLASSRRIVELALQNMAEALAEA
ncbi:MAG: aminotransferase class I/II-fold pyridoxal phosphate-dependent enzyme [Gemmatimonadota bacterium]|nr:aminotransferase class I/II-fold pyridoxal phosphate-dependent enzyme [Gemmatimonadota bacterium]MDE2986157.1 aminotransferase class I/II-fold pyridoxal phosphate-dependent enzyme [Gemmatimonadota bacterium]